MGGLMEMMMDAIKLWHTDPQGAATKLRDVASKLIAIAEKLEIQNLEIHSREGGWMSDGGLGDKVLINVIGPDGSTKQTVTQG